MIDCSRTKNYLAEKQRMTKKHKPNNGIGEPCFGLETLYPEKVIAIVQKWSDEHPQKTYLSEFLKHYPNAPLGDGGTPTGICPYELGLMGAGDCRNDGDCVKCWNQPIEESESK
ncbi:hypothetical protein [Ruminococcus sp.]|jgi:hypothetical protein|uniref:hypothetical protein n=1 Tax=Ruminococcus sp. TaxID=41978 RepID=UPI0025D397E2|nr:hypothetical protein [Ruminococcus sp.]